MIYTVTFNPSIDYIVSVEQFQIGKVNRTFSEMVYPGGKGINVSQVLCNLGVDNIALGFVAGVTGEHLITLLEQTGVKQDFVSVKDGMTRINVKLHFSRHEEETEINGQGPFVSEEELNCLVERIQKLTEEDILVVSGSVPRGVKYDIYGTLLQICNQRNIKVIVDSSGELLVNSLEYKPFLIKPNHHELEEIFVVENINRDQIISYAKELKTRGASNVLVSMGKMGAILIAEDGEVYESKAPAGQVVHAVGAGDSMVAGFLAGYLEKKLDSQKIDYAYALKMGISAGSATAFSEALASRDMVDKLMKIV